MTLLMSNTPAKGAEIARQFEQIFNAKALGGVSYSVESQASVSTGEHTPFWFVHNREGLGSLHKNSGYLRAGLFRDINASESPLKWGAGVDMAAAWSYDSPVILQQLYFDMRYRCLGLTIGMKEGLNQEVNNRELGTGNMLYSGNARPIPQVRAGIPQWTAVPMTNKWFHIKGYVAYGAFTDSEWQYDFSTNHTGSKYTQNVLYHSKALFMKVEKPDILPLWIEGGLEMAAQFGGKSIKKGSSEIITMPSGFKSYLKALIPMAGDSSTPSGEQTNIEGNHVGCWDAKIGWNITHSLNMRVYYNHFFEDHSQMTFDYDWRDGLWGFEINLPQTPLLSQVVYEYLISKDQSGPVYNDYWVNQALPEQVSGRDNYYNHYIYAGWQNRGMGIGNPLLLSPIYNTNGSLIFKYTRVKAHHFGVKGQFLPEWAYKVLFTKAEHWGTYDNPLPEVKWTNNGLIEVSHTPSWSHGIEGAVTFGWDYGNLIGDSYGLMLTLRKTGLL